MRVYNHQRYAIGRGGLVFAPHTITSDVPDDERLRRLIGTSPYLEILPAEDGPKDDGLETLTKAQKRELADEMGLDVPSKATSAELSAAIRKAGWKPSDPEPPAETEPEPPVDTESDTTVLERGA